MPGWHETTREFARDGRLLNVGILEEQHPDRARLFLQWKGIDWPMLVDPLNRLDVDVVPITLLIDENGVIRRRVGRRDDVVRAIEEFLAAPPVEPLPPEPRSPTLDERIGRAAFELGVHYRERYDAGGDPADFTRAVEAWGRAVEADPNQYVWRRRIQQYGPRLDKPYPFYDWVAAARAEIRARGETPVALSVEPSGAELAAPIEHLDAAAPATGEPDPEGKVSRDDGAFVRSHATVVPDRVAPGGSARVHLEFRPADQDAHWNNEAGGMILWVDSPEGWTVDRRRIERPVPAAAVSDEPRRIEFEVQAPEQAAGEIGIPVYALYYVCRGEAGACVYRRADLPVTVRVDGGAVR